MLPAMVDTQSGIDWCKTMVVNFALALNYVCGGGGGGGGGWRRLALVAAAAPAAAGGASTRNQDGSGSQGRKEYIAR